MLSMNDIRDFRGVCALFTENIPPRLVRLNLLGLTIVLVWHIHYEHIILLHFICYISFVTFHFIWCKSESNPFQSNNFPNQIDIFQVLHQTGIPGLV